MSDRVDLIQKRLHGLATAEELKELDALLASSPEAAAAYGGFFNTHNFTGLFPARAARPAAAWSGRPWHTGRWWPGPGDEAPG